MSLHKPLHPGGIIKAECLEPLGLTVTAAAEWLGVGRVSLSEMLNARSGVSPEMALRLEAAGWGKAEGWLGMQLDYDLWKVKQQVGKRIKVKRFPSPQPA